MDSAAPEARAVEPLPLSQLLAHIIDEHGGDRLTLSHLSALLRDRMWGGMLLTFAAINILPLPPGTTTVTGLPLVLITAQMAMGRARPWFPRKIDERGLTKNQLGQLLARLLPWERRVESIFKPRMAALTSHRAMRVIGIVSFILSVILWLPIPLGNHAPALAMSLFALALIYRDGVLVILGVLATILSVVLVSFTIGAAWVALLFTLRHLFPALGAGS